MFLFTKMLLLVWLLRAGPALQCAASGAQDRDERGRFSWRELEFASLLGQMR